MNRIIVLAVVGLYACQSGAPRPAPPSGARSSAPPHSAAETEPRSDTNVGDPPAAVARGTGTEPPATGDPAPEPSEAPPIQQAPIDPQRPLTVAAWLPYWHQAQGADIAREHIEHFDSVSPFAYEVDADGTLVDKMARRAGQWSRLRRAARAHDVTVIPSLAWMSGAEQHALLSDPAARAAHIERIVTLVREQDFDGIDIDYEGRDVADRDAFSDFLRELHPRLRALPARLVCTVEGREAHDPPEGANYGQRMPYSVDYAVLGQECDEVRLMAYGQWFLQNGAREFTTDGEAPYAPNTDVAWVERVIAYAQRHIPNERIVLGVPTHGRLFRLGGGPRHWTYESLSAIHITRVRELGALPSARLDRPPSGELRLRYGSGARRRLAYVADAVTLRQRVALARRTGITGVALFKIDGREDAATWRVLRAARRRVPANAAEPSDDE